MFTIRKNLKATEGAPPNTRVNPETGEVETSLDDGATWVPNPDVDPRQNPAYQLPPNTETDPKCAAAAGMVANTKRVIDGMGLGLSIAAFATLLLTLLLIPGIGWMFAAMILFATTFTGATALATYAAYTEEVYEALLCSFYDQLDENGVITLEGYSAVVDDMSAQFPDPLIHDSLQAIGTMHGLVGINNAGVVYADPEADCEACAPCSVDLYDGCGYSTITNVGGNRWRVVCGDTGGGNVSACINIVGGAGCFCYCDLVVTGTITYTDVLNCDSVNRVGMPSPCGGGPHRTDINSWFIQSNAGPLTIEFDAYCNDDDPGCF